MRIRQLRDMNVFKAAVKSVDHVALIPEVQHALAKWISEKTGPLAPGVLIGGLAMSFYATPRTTQDVDLLFLTTNEIPKAVPGFKRYRPGAFQDNKSHVDIEVTTSESFNNLPLAVTRKVTGTAILHGNIKVASREGMIALKLCSSFGPGRASKDKADIVSLLKGHLLLAMADWPLEEKHFSRLEETRIEASE